MTNESNSQGNAEGEQISSSPQQGRNGDEEIWSAVYPEIRRLADAALAKEYAPLSVQATEIAHQAYLKLADKHPAAFQSRAHLLATVGKVIRQLLIDKARARKAAKRGGGGQREPLENWLASLQMRSPQVFVLTEALSEMEAIYPRQAKLVELRFFGGLSMDEAAEALSVSPRTAAGDWALAKAWLRGRLEETS